MFTQISPYRSCLDAVVSEIENGNRDEIDAVAGNTFEEWEIEPEEAEEWDKTHPTPENSIGPLSEELVGNLRFHTLPICFERGRFTIVEKLPYWARYVEHNRDQQLLVEQLGGRALCVPDAALKGWHKNLNGETPILEGQVSTKVDSKSYIGRPSKVPKAVMAYKSIYPNGHTCPWKKAVISVSEVMEETISVQTLRRAVAAIRSTEKDRD